MKLRAKLTVFSIALTAAAVIACCFLILSFAQKDALSNIIENGLGDYDEFYFSLRGALFSSGDITPSIQRSFVLSAFRSVSGSNEYTLRSGGDFLSNNMGFDVESMMGNAQTADEMAYPSLQYKTVHVNGKDYFVAHSAFDFQNAAYGLSILDKAGDNQYIAEYNGVKCTAIYNPFVGRFYVDDKYGVIKDRAPAPIRHEPSR